MADSTYFGMFSEGREGEYEHEEGEEILILTKKEAEDWKNLPWLIKMKENGELTGQPVVVEDEEHEAEEDEELTKAIHEWAMEKAGGRRRRNTRKAKKSRKSRKGGKKAKKTKGRRRY